MKRWCDAMALKWVLLKSIAMEGFEWIWKRACANFKRWNTETILGMIFCRSWWRFCPRALVNFLGIVLKTCQQALFLACSDDHNKMFPETIYDTKTIKVIYQSNLSFKFFSPKTYLLFLTQMQLWLEGRHVFQFLPRNSWTGEYKPHCTFIILQFYEQVKTRQ